MNSWMKEIKNRKIVSRNISTLIFISMYSYNIIDAFCGFFCKLSVIECVIKSEISNSPVTKLSKCYLKRLSKLQTKNNKCKSEVLPTLLDFSIRKITKAKMAVRSPDVEAERIPLTSINSSPTNPLPMARRKFYFKLFYFSCFYVKMLGILGPISNENLLNVCMTAF